MSEWPIAHGSPGIAGMTLDWPLDPLPMVVALAAAVGYLVAWRAVNARHPANPITTCLMYPPETFSLNCRLWLSQLSKFEDMTVIGSSSDETVTVTAQ